MTTKRQGIAALRERLRSDDGIGLVEVLVALMIFSVIALGMAYSLASMSRLTRESTAREVAANLASAEIDRIQSKADTFDVHDEVTTPQVDGVTYTVTTHVAWVTTTGQTGTCGSGGGNLQYKAVNVEVTWPGMYLSNPVRADSALAPSTRVNDPSYGTILVSVTGAIDGSPQSGVTITVTPTSGGGGMAITDTIDPTDADGCTYVLKVAPGKYTITASKSGYIDYNQVTSPSYPDQIIDAGSTFSAQFQYDSAGTFTMKYAATSTLAPIAPSNLETTFYGGLNPYANAAPASTVKLHPYPGGYQAVAGDPVTCKATDPSKWTATNSGGNNMSAGIRAPSVTAAPGGSATLPVPMGVVNVKMPTDANRFITAVMQYGTVSGGYPGCAIATTGKDYTFNTAQTKGTTVPIALPYGKWKIYTSTTLTGTRTQLLAASLTPVDGVVSVVAATGVLKTGILGISAVASDIVTLDPRVKN